MNNKTIAKELVKLAGQLVAGPQLGSLQAQAGRQLYGFKNSIATLRSAVQAYDHENDPENYGELLDEFEKIFAAWDKFYPVASGMLHV